MCDLENPFVEIEMLQRITNILICLVCLGILGGWAIQYIFGSMAFVLTYWGAMAAGSGAY